MTRDWVRLGTAIRAAYQAMGLNQRQFYETAGISRSTMRRLEAGDGPEPSTATLIRVEKAVGWPIGTCLAIAEGAEPPEPGPVRQTTIPKPPAWASDPGLLDRLPEQIQAELQEGHLLGLDVIEVGPPEARARMVVVVKRDESGTAPDPEAVRAAIEDWKRRQQELRKRPDA